MTEVTETKSEQASEQNLNIFMRNITQIMDRLEEIQKKIGPPDFGNTGTGLKGSLLKLFEACCPLSRKQSDDQLWEEHQRIRTLLEDEFIPKSNNISDTFSRRNRSISIETLFDDLVKSGANLSKLRLEFVGGEVRVIAKENIDPMTPLAMIPTSSIILADFFSQHEGLNHLVNKDPILSSMHNILLAYGLLIEFYRGQDSSFYNYIQALPDCYENSYYYSLEDLKLLRGSASFRDALNNWKSAVRQYAYFHLKIVETMEGGEDLKDRQYMEKFQIASRFCFEDYRWAVATVAAKSLSIPSLGPHSINLALIPIIDLLKHSNTVTSFNYESQERLLVVSNGFEMLSGEEVSIFYGARTNSQFVLNHGFFYEENIHEFCMIRIPLKDTSTKVVKHSLLGKLGISELNGIPIGYLSGETWTGDIVSYMRIYEADDEDLEKIKSIPDEEFLQRMKNSDPISEKNEISAKASFKTILSSLVEGYKKNPEEEDKILQSEESTDQAKMIIKLKKKELYVLENNLQNFDGGEGLSVVGQN